MFPGQRDVTELLIAAGRGDQKAAEDLLPLVYHELRDLARSHMRRERQGHTMQPTALVHEAYLKLVGKAEIQWDGRGHFFAAAARAMRQILVEKARYRGRIKRGGEQKRVDLGDHLPAEESPSADLLALDDALTRLEARDRRKCDVVMLRYFAGLSVEETAAALQISPATARNDWTFAKAWLHRELAGEDLRPAPEA